MTTEYLITYALIFGAVFSLIIFVSTLSKNRNLSQYKNLPIYFYMFQGAITFFSLEIGSMLVKSSSKNKLKMEKMLRQSALSLQVQDVYGAAIVLALIFGIIGGTVLFMLKMALPLKLLLGTIFIVIGAIIPFFNIWQIAQKRSEEILRDLPFIIDIISSSMNAGLDFNASVAHLSEIKNKDHVVLKDEFMSYLKEVQLGKSRAEALRDMEKRICVKEFSRFIFAILHGIETGVSIVEVMRVQAVEIRRLRSTLAEQEAAKAPSKMIVPMVIFIFPSMFIIIFTPILIKMKDSPIFSFLKW
ncbi:MAG: type II secretion system F family protein [Lentisphaeria bacterium]|nr:type II secretion system F family protein [Lentisphaeria bacterium]